MHEIPPCVEMRNCTGDLPGGPFLPCSVCLLYSVSLVGHPAGLQKKDHVLVVNAMKLAARYEFETGVDSQCSPVNKACDGTVVLSVEGIGELRQGDVIIREIVPAPGIGAIVKVEEVSLDMTPQLIEILTGYISVS